jgi:hypothetical protein
MADEAPSNERAALIRGLSSVDATMLPGAPSAFQPLDATDQSRLRKVAKEHEAELRGALDQIAARGGAIKADLGNNAPNPDRSTALSAKLKANRAAKLKLEALLAYIDDSNAVALNDAVLLLEDVRDLLVPNLKSNAGLGELFSETFDYFDAVGQKISEGIARKKKVEK